MLTWREKYLLLTVCFFLSLLAGCEAPSSIEEQPRESKGGAPVFTIGQEEEHEHPLKGQMLDITILGPAEWHPSELIGELGPMFSAYAKTNYGYDVNVTFVGSPFWSLFDKVSASLSIGSQEFNIMVIDSQWLGALAENGWIVPLNELVEQVSELDIEWWDPVVKEAYIEYPMGSDRFWGFPQESDVIALYVRKDLFTDPVERKAFKDKYGFDLPRDFADFENLSMEDFERIASFFTRPKENLYGTVMQYSKQYDFMTMYLYPFMFSQGGKIWDPENQRIYGVINSDINAEAMRWNRRFLQYQPPDAIHYGISENRDAFVQGKVATAFQWAAMGMNMITEENKDNILIVPPPGFKQSDGSLRRVYSIGGQPWVINAFNDEVRMRATIDFLKWWYLPETQREFAKRGGNPADKATLAAPGFDQMHSWFPVLKYMLSAKRAKDFWHHPKYKELLQVQQEVFTAYAGGRIDDPDFALEYVACRQQQILVEHGSSDYSPPESCNAVIQKGSGLFQ